MDTVQAQTPSTVKRPTSPKYGSQQGSADQAPRQLLESYGVQFDAQGHPVWHHHEEVVEKLARKLLSHYGEAIRTPLNESLADHGLPQL
ncbi:MAG: hypothetical protein LBT78_07580 [Tannerella sp.]|jgi:hypothetical protein|nr:hypothetical protein [Tannerella sp.]